MIPPFDPGSDGVYASVHRNHSFARPSRRRAGPVAHGSESRGSSSWHATVKLKDGGDGTDSVSIDSVTVNRNAVNPFLSKAEPRASS